MYNLKKCFNATSILSLLLMLPTTSVHAEEVINGRVHDHDGAMVHACFDAAAKLQVGAEFAVVRHTILTQPKTHTAMKSERVGLIRIVSIGNDRCAQAELVRGSAQALDWIANPGA